MSDYERKRINSSSIFAIQKGGKNRRNRKTKESECGMRVPNVISIATSQIYCNTICMTQCDHIMYSNMAFESSRAYPNINVIKVTNKTTNETADYCGG